MHLCFPTGFVTRSVVYRLTPGLKETQTLAAAALREYLRASLHGLDGVLFVCAMK